MLKKDLSFSLKSQSSSSTLGAHDDLSPSSKSSSTANRHDIFKGQEIKWISICISPPIYDDIPELSGSDSFSMFISRLRALGGIKVMYPFVIDQRNIN